MRSTILSSSSAEVMMIALTRLDKALRDEPAQLIATVHDEAVLLVPDDPAAVERIGAVAQKEMIAAFLDVFPEAPTLGLVNAAVGPTWGDLVPLQEWLLENYRRTKRARDSRQLKEHRAMTVPLKSQLNEIVAVDFSRDQVDLMNKLIAGVLAGQ
jgi:hypothetical protein